MYRIILIGMKSSGKTTIGKVLAQRLTIPFMDLDAEIEQHYAKDHGESLGFRDIFKKWGQDYFRSLEYATLKHLSATQDDKNFVLAVGGGTPLDERNRAMLRALGTVVFIDANERVLLPRVTSGGVPPFFPYPEDPARSLTALLAVRRPVYQHMADIVLQTGIESPETLAMIIVRRLSICT